MSSLYSVNLSRDKGKLNITSLKVKKCLFEGFWPCWLVCWTWKILNFHQNCSLLTGLWKHCETSTFYKLCSILPKFTMKSDPKVARPAFSTWSVQNSWAVEFEICGFLESNAQQSQVFSVSQVFKTPFPVSLRTCNSLKFLTILFCKNSCSNLVTFETDSIEASYSTNVCFTRLGGLFQLHCRVLSNRVSNF